MCLALKGPLRQKGTAIFSIAPTYVDTAIEEFLFLNKSMRLLLYKLPAQRGRIFQARLFLCCFSCVSIATYVILLFTTSFFPLYVALLPQG